MSSKNIKSKKDSESKKDIENLEYNTTVYKLYGMTLEQYTQGQTIHSQCFNQLKNVQLNKFTDA